MEQIKLRKSIVAIVIVGAILFGGLILVSYANDPQSGENKEPPNGTTERDTALKEAAEAGYLLLVNKQNPVDAEYVPDDLTGIKYFVSDRPEASRYMREVAAIAFEQMVEAAATEQIELKMTTAYRSYGFQKLLYENYVNLEGEAEASKFSAKPGQSEHQTGLAVDVSSASVGYELVESFGDTDEGRWLASHAHAFGFILRYQKGKEDITGYQYEPWHIRYVGLLPAKEMYQQAITLEEYLQQNNMIVR